MSSLRAQLDQRLSSLAYECDALCAAVLDTSGVEFGVSRPMPEGTLAVAEEALSLVVDALRKRPPARGGHVHLLHGFEAPFVAAESFAGVYLLIVLFDEPFGAGVVMHEIKLALPEIEALTLALPPLDPERQAGAIRRLRSV